ncbi:hypothetical protein ACQ4PT_043567 [Festuca glaucescens]
MPTDREVITQVETADVQYEAAVAGREVITGADTADVLHNAATAGGEVITGADVFNVQYSAAAAGAQLVSSFAVDSSQDHVAMATSSPVAGDKTMHAPAERASTFTATIQSSSTLSTVKASATMANSNEVHGTSSESLLVPKVGMAFKSEEDAYEFYNEYAGKIGFSIRKSHSKLRPDKSVYQKHIVCSNEGERGTHSKHDTLKQNAATRSRCDARIQFSVTREDQCAAMAKAIDKVFPGTKHRLCLWHIYQNAAKHLSHVISNHPWFLVDFKRVVYLENSVAYFEQKWQELLVTYDLVENSWIQTLYGLREKWAAVYRNDSFSADMTSTQRSEGMNNVFKKQFRKKLCVSELLVEYEKCAASLRGNELDADFKSRKSKPVPFVRNLPMLKTAAESYTRRIYNDFEEEFKQQHSVKCESLLCKHALRVFNINEVFTLPSQYILHRWTKYAKRGYSSNNQDSPQETLQTCAARISRKATSVALKCSVSEELLVELEKAIDMLDLEADESLSQRGPAKPESVRMNSNLSSEDVTNGKISFKVPQAIKGPMVKRAKDTLEKKVTKKAKTGTKKPKSGTKKGSATPIVRSLTIEAGTFDASTGTNIAIPHIPNNMYHGQSPLQFTAGIGPNITMPHFSNNMFHGQGPLQFTAGTSSNITMPHFSNNMLHGQGPLQFAGSFEASTSSNSTVPHFTNTTFHGDSSTMFRPFIQGGYTELLLQTDQASEVLHPSRRLDFDQPNTGGRKE